MILAFSKGTLPTGANWYQTLQLGVLLLKLLQSLRLVHLQPTVLLTPAEVRLLHNTGFLTRHSSRLPVRDRDLDLPQQIYHLLRLVLLASSHMLSLSSVSLRHWHISSRALPFWLLRPFEPEARRISHLTPV